MPVHFRKGCIVCDRIRGGEVALERRINNSKSFVPGGESLRAIAAVTGISYNSVWNHAKRHQAPKKDQLLATRTRAKLKTMEVNREVAEIKDYTNHYDARRTLLEEGLRALQEGDMKMTASVMAALLKQESDIEQKEKDRGMEAMKMFNLFASGAATKEREVIEPNESD